MTYNGKEVAFPARISLSFFKVIESLEEQAKSTEAGQAAFAQALLRELEPYPELRDGITDLSRLEQYDVPIRKLSRVLFPDVLTTNEIKILTPLFHFIPLYTSRRFENLVAASSEPLQFTMKGVDEEMLYRYACYFILSSYFGFPVRTMNTQIFEIGDRNTDITRTYKMLLNADLCEFVPTERATTITQQDYELLLNNFDDMALWKEKFPPESWVLRGVGLINLVDITPNQSLSTITSNLIAKSDDTFERIQSEICKLLGDASVRLGIMTLEENALIASGKDQVPSILVPQGEHIDCSLELCPDSRQQLVVDKEPFIITDVEAFHQQTRSHLSTRLQHSGLKSYIVIPLLHEEEFLGYVELGAPEPFALHKGSLYLLEKVLPILAMAFKRFMTEAQNTIEAIIQQECTTIHPSVKWRFEEEARKFMIQTHNGGHPTFNDIVFDHLYPLYGQLDIKGSSERRNRAVRTDLIKQLRGVSAVLEAARRQMPMPAIEELCYRIERYTEDLQEEFNAGSEHKILDFLNAEVYPVFAHLREESVTLRDQVRTYYDLLDPELHTVYEARKAYDSSVNQINQRLASYLDVRQAEAQRVFPHYFERYKTDGVEFNMYIGQSITRERKFHTLYLHNLRLWQLLVMCEMENEFRAIQRELDTSIEVASLVLVYNTPIAVHFRMDEKQFDVEGAYNARYEIIKKRVDKAHIKGTQERITRPGSLVIVYSQEQDAQEYRRYLDYLIGIDRIRKHYEDLALEDLQGVHGLRALRAEIAYQQALTVEELVDEVEARQA